MLADPKTPEVPVFETFTPIPNPNEVVGNHDVGGTFEDVESE